MKKKQSKNSPADSSTCMILAGEVIRPELIVRMRRVGPLLGKSACKAGSITLDDLTAAIWANIEGLSPKEVVALAVLVTNAALTINMDMLEEELPVLPEKVSDKIH